MNKSTLCIVKIGGEILNSEKKKNDFLDHFTAMSGLRVLVHGGGKQASYMAEQLGIEKKMHQGRRITDADTLDIALMVYGGLLNKNLVSSLQARDCPACGISGADGNAIRAVKRPPHPIDFGYAGDIEQVNTSFFQHLLGADYIPVLCALTHDGKGQMLNTNADTIAAEIAIALTPFYKTTLCYVFDKPGVLESISDESSVVTELDTGLYGLMVEKNQITDGMIPKLDTGFHALKNQVSAVSIGNATMLTSQSPKATQLKL